MVINSDTELLVKILQQLAAANATADDLLDLLLSMEAEVASGSLTETLASSSVVHDATTGLHATGPSDATDVKLNPKGPIKLFIPSQLTHDGHRQHMYNGFVFNLPPPDSTGEIYLVICGQCVGIFDTWYALQPSGDLRSGR